MKKTYSTILSAISLITLPISLTSCYSLTANNIVEINIFEDTIETTIKHTFNLIKEEERESGTNFNEEQIINAHKNFLSNKSIFEYYVGFYFMTMPQDSLQWNYHFFDKYSIFNNMDVNKAIDFIKWNKSTFTFMKWNSGFINNDWDWYVNALKYFPIKIENPLFKNKEETYQNNIKPHSIIFNENAFSTLYYLNISNINENNIWDYITVQKMPPQPWWIDQKIPPRDQAFQLTFKYKKNNLIYQSISPIYSWWKTA